MFTIETYTGADGTPLRYGKLVNTDPSSIGAQSKRTLLFVPGLGGSVKGALVFLQELIPYYHTIYGPDLRSFGLNPVKEPLRSTAPILADLQAFQTQMLSHLPGSIDLAGISLGGVIATHLTVDRPLPFERFICLAPAYHAHPKMFPLSYQLKNIWGRLLQGSHHKIRLPYGIEALTRNQAILNDPAFHDSENPLYLTIDFLLSVKSLSSKAFEKTRQIKIPTYVVVPDKDVVCDPITMEQGFERIPQGIRKVCDSYPELYHDVLFEPEAPQIAHKVLEWLEQTESAHAATEKPTTQAVAI